MEFQKISNELIYSTVNINCTLENGEQTTGTGFFCNLEETEEGTLTVIVTNKHLIKDAVFGEIDFPVMNNEIEEFETISMDDFESHWILHPDDKIDLCVLPVAGYIEFDRFEKEKILLGFSPITLGYFPEYEELKGLGAIEDIIMIGYPDGLMDEVNLKPIVRKGITATSINIDYEDKPEFLIDIACFEGSSGSPVLIYNQGMWIGKEGNAMIGVRVMLLGVLYAGFDKNIEGELVKTEVKNLKIPKIKIPLNLGVVVKAEKILEFKEIIKKNVPNRV